MKFGFRTSESRALKFGNQIFTSLKTFFCGMRKPFPTNLKLSKAFQIPESRKLLLIFQELQDLGPTKSDLEALSGYKSIQKIA